MTHYFDLEFCARVAFPYIYKQMTAAEPAPQYDQYPDGMAEFGKVLTFVRNDDYYPTFFDKAAYLMFSIAASQYFPNGNKRLGIVVLIMFLVYNQAEMLDCDEQEFREILTRRFPSFSWEENLLIDVPHTLFLYNLAIAIGDRSMWGTNDASEARENIAKMFRDVYRL